MKMEVLYAAVALIMSMFGIGFWIGYRMGRADGARKALEPRS